MATRPKAVIESRNGEKFSPITIAKNVLTDDGQNLHDILSDRKEDMMTPTIENSSSMFKVGQGDNVDYSENVIDGAYESCVLKGITKFIDNDTGEILDSFVENRDLSLIDCKSPILSNVGKNLFNGNFMVGDILTSNGSYHESGKSWAVTDYINVSNMKDITFSSSLPFNVANFVYFKYDKNKNYLGYIGIYNSFSIASTSLEEDVCYVRFRVPSAIPNNSKFQIEEGVIATSYEPYKTNILSCNGDKIELTEDMFEQGAIAQYINSQNTGKTYQWMKDNSDPNYDKRRLRLKRLVKVKPNTNLLLQNLDNFMYSMCGFDSNKLTLSTFDTSWIQNAKVTIPQDVHYIGFFIRKKDDTAITINDFNNTNFTLSEVNKTIVLRSLPNGVCDTLNAETGEYVQRIGEVMFDGSENWDSHSNNSTYTSSKIFALKNNLGTNTESNCDKFAATNGNIAMQDGLERIKHTATHTYINITNNRYGGGGSKDFKTWLSQNPVTFQYELAEPIVKTVDLSGFPYAYKNGHVVLSSGSIEQSLTPKVEYSVVTNRNGQIRSNQKMVERHQKQLDRLQAMILINLVNTQYEQTLTNLKYDLKNVREEVK